MLGVDVVAHFVLRGCLFKARQQSRVLSLQQLRRHLQHPQLQLLYSHCYLRLVSCDPRCCVLSLLIVVHSHKESLLFLVVFLSRITSIIKGFQINHKEIVLLLHHLPTQTVSVHLLQLLILQAGTLRNRASAHPAHENLFNLRRFHSRS